MMVPFSPLNDQFTTYPAVNGVQPVPGAIFANGSDFTAGNLEPAEPQDEGHKEKEAIEGVYDGGPQPVANEPLANKMNGVPPTTAGPSRGPLLPVDHVDDTAILKARLRENGASAEAANLCDDVFPDGVTTDALEKRLTRDQCERHHLQDGKQFQRFLEKVEVTGETKNRCRLCNAKLYKHHRDALRHLLKDHFGLWFGCAHW